MQRKKFWISFPSTTVVACLLCAWALLGLLGVQRGSPCRPGPQVWRKGGGIMWGGASTRREAGGGGGLQWSEEAFPRSWWRLWVTDSPLQR